jgi:hypothetical protein
MVQTQSANPLGLQHGSKWTAPQLLPEQRGAHISSSSRIAGRGRLLTVTIVATLNSLTTPYDLRRSPL